MNIDSLTDTLVVFERQVPITITCNSQKNNNGVIEVDDLNNKLISIIDNGDTKIGRLVSYSGNEPILFYNRTTKGIRVVDVGDMIDLPIDFIQGTQYYLGAKVILAKYSGDYMFDTNIVEPYQVFKVFLDDGREIKSFIIEEGKIKVTGTDRLYVSDFSELIVYMYKENSLKKSSEFKIEYMGYTIIYDEGQFMEGEYLEDVLGMEVDCFESLEVSQNVTKDDYKKDFHVSSRTIINSVENVINFDLFNRNGIRDVVTSFNNVEFRVVLCNRIFGRVVIINNCRIVDSISLTYEKSLNKKKFSVSCGNYIDITLSNPSYYGLDRYGRGTYSEGRQVFNSARRGGFR